MTKWHQFDGPTVNLIAPRQCVLDVTDDEDACVVTVLHARTSFCRCVYMECELEVQVYEPIQFDSIDCVLCRATSLQKETTSSPCRRSLLAKIRQKFW